MSEEKNKIELRSDEVEDIMGKVPGWITRNGILVLLMLIMVLLLGSWAFKIPDVKRATVFVTSVQPPVDIEARSDGKVVELLVEDNAAVDAGDILAVIENPSEFKDVLGLREKLHKLEIPPSAVRQYDLPVNGEADLGTIQSSYAAFYKNFVNYRKYVELDYHQRKIGLLNEEYEKYMVYGRNLSGRAATVREEFELAYKQYERDSALYLEGVVSESAYEDANSNKLSKQANWQQINSLIAGNDIQASVIREQILEMELKEQEQLNSYTVLLEESLNNLKGSIASWEKSYLIISPISGHVTFNQIWSANQNVKTGEKVMTVVPIEQSELIGKILLPLKGAGEVKPEQVVNIRFANFPYLEYGMVKGRVSNVSKVPQNDFYTVEVILPEGLTTYYGHTIAFSQNMQGEAEIQTEKMRLIQWIFNPLRNAISRQREM